MLPTRTASAFHAAVHDLKVQRLARAAARRLAEKPIFQKTTEPTMHLQRAATPGAPKVTPNAFQQLHAEQPGAVGKRV